ncbi:MAG: guanitoxin biosynthesis heme-dependent pre-guanitoxin N-hydroxylase GntA [Phycisphaerales bacterium]
MSANVTRDSSAFRATASRVFRPGEDGRLLLERPGCDQPGPPDASCPPHVVAAHAALRAFVEHEAYPCVGAKAAIHSGSYRFGAYPPLATDAAIEASVRDLQWFASAAPSIDPQYATFVAVFDGPPIADDEEFELLLWAHLNGMHHADAVDYDWDPRVSDDPERPDFSFSIGGEAFFLIGMHPQASRLARRFPFPTIVWNLHAQFERLREEGKFARMREVVRERDEALQGGENPELRDFGDGSEARQYSGRSHPPDWSAPFELRRRTEREASQIRSAEGVAPAEVATPEPSFEPADPLRRCAVRE